MLYSLNQMAVIDTDFVCGDLAIEFFNSTDGGALNSDYFSTE